ncbi:DUF305 domain-containing protein [Streptomyces yaanensis]|uniref:DUF305 domain-containing protein n=1 Tax=Streptomyces yaanensis TaxID=1142239 RepID=A0ABV7S485_9ACTN|nr:DUF305 domain-containing protein [Streptomyces sp. CGMCC 4.7035]WNB99491.1 DUF305 domain-containing protein [Streptomyces sp. CGMCC 4.7035]
MNSFDHTRAPGRHASVVSLLALPLAVALLAGCDSGSSTNSAAPKGPSVIAPGKPGEAAKTLSAEEAATRRAEDDTPNAADFSYARMMIEHHAQALEMARLAPKHAESEKVKRLAERIVAAQKPEIAAMEGWLKTHDSEGQGPSHQHGTMPGMATEAQLKRLRAAEGEAFDELFLKLMITHHGGAITMATEVKAQGNNLQIEEMADDVIAQQTSEISRMRDML